MADKFSGRWKLRSPRRKKTEPRNDKLKGTATDGAASSGLGSEEPSPSPSPLEVHTAPGSSAPEIPPNGTSTITININRANVGRWKDRGRVRGARLCIETLTASGGDNDEGTMSPLLPRRPELRRDPRESELFNLVLSRSEGTTSDRNDLGPHSQSRDQGTSPSRPSNDDPGIQDEPEREHTLAPHQCPSGVAEGVEGDDVTTSRCCRRATQQANGALQHPTGGQQRPFRILSIGIYLNGIAAVLASFAVVAGAESKALVKAVLSESNVTIVPAKRYTSRGSVVAVHMSVDHKNRVFACVATVNVPLAVAFGLLDEVKIDYMLTASGLAFSTAENCHDKMCHAWMAKLWDKYERLAESFAQELKTLSSSHIGVESIDAAAWLNGETRKIDCTPHEVIRLDFRFSQERAVVAAAREFLPGVPGIGIVGSTVSGDERRTGFRVTLALVLIMGAASLVVMFLYWLLTVFL